MNVELLRKIAAVIQVEPQKLEMGDWETNTPCGTAYCIGGWAHHFAGGEPGTATHYKARKALGLDWDESDRLFYCTDWPKQFRGSVDARKPSPEQAAARIEHFIETGGRE